MPRPRKNIDPDYCVKEYLSGRSIQDIARQLKVSATRVKGELVDAGVGLRTRSEISAATMQQRKAITKNMEGAVVRDYAEGMSCLAVAKKYGVQRSAVAKTLSEHGVHVRNGSEASKLRMSKLSPGERSALASAAHDAIRGTKKSFATKVRNAIAKQAAQSGASWIEEMVCSDLKSCLIHPIPQLAIGPYNCDLACHPVAVEIFGGHWHFSGRHLSRAHERIKYLGNAGWHVLMLIVNESSTPAYRYTIKTGDYIVSYIQEARANPSSPREYRVVNCCGETLAAGRCNDDHISIIPAFTNRRNPTTGRYERVPR